ncbi:hypothetical protein [Plebeiibacterium sediminum]|uniref:hypothetical protein n=1 Tax=Plebeiibacterium sediminum TaxID=2992112 RepID=UPI00263B4A2A|nr:hypothetical protein [Plebeiobacterium sediminum]
MRNEPLGDLKLVSFIFKINGTVILKPPPLHSSGTPLKLGGELFTALLVFNKSSGFRPETYYLCIRLTA